MAPRPKDHNPSGLGRAIINRKIRDSRRQEHSGLYTLDSSASDRLKSVTQEKGLDEFFNTANLAGIQFTAERRNIKVIQQAAPNSHNPYLLNEQEEKQTLKKHAEHKQRLLVPRRPSWNKQMTTNELDKQEQSAFLDWRRGLAQLQEKEKLVLTPFEKNLEVWRQLWRVLERSHLLVQIVDARNPLRFRCEDLEAYVRDMECTEYGFRFQKGKKKSLLLINKADFLTKAQRSLWADYFDSQQVLYAFFSASNASAQQQARRLKVDAWQTRYLSVTQNMATMRNEGSVEYGNEIKVGFESSNFGTNPSESEEDDHFSTRDVSDDENDARTKIFSVSALESWFLEMASDLSDPADHLEVTPTKLVVGLVGYPNVGKSSTINALLGEKKVSVSSTPGKTKHFQTIHLSDSIVLCDCPGLVFPQFATTKADLVCDGVLPIDQLREYTGPTSLVVRRIPQPVLEATYGLSIPIKELEDGSGQIMAEDFLITYATARGFMRSGLGNPDEARAARYVLKDYVNGKLLFCHPPPGVPQTAFNHETHERLLLRVARKKRVPGIQVGNRADNFTASVPNQEDAASRFKSRLLDQAFFVDSSPVARQPFIQSPLQYGQAYIRATMFPQQNIVADDGSPLDGSRMTKVVDKGNKRHKKIRRQKQRGGQGYASG